MKLETRETLVVVCIFCKWGKCKSEHALYHPSTCNFTDSGVYLGILYTWIQSPSSMHNIINKIKFIEVIYLKLKVENS